MKRCFCGRKLLLLAMPPRWCWWGHPGRAADEMVNQICIAGLVQALSEAINFGQRAELDMQKVLEVIGGGRRNLGSWSIAATL